jgi:hypothetical protein
MEEKTIIDLLISTFSKRSYQVIRPGCCGKKRKSSQCYWIDGYDSSTWKCKDGFGCKKQIN